MNIDDTLLMAYVDGDLPPARHAEIEDALALSPELAERAAALRASVLPYQAAFAQQPLERVPDSLARFVAELARTGVAPPIAAETTGAGAGEHGAQSRVPDDGDAFGSPTLDADTAPAKVTPIAAAQSASAARRRDTRRPAVWLAAAFIAGAFICGTALKLGPKIGEPRVAPWVDAAAGYQDLYTRETLADLPDDAAANASANARLLDNVHRDDHLPIAIPDLRNAGLTFKRIQRLRFKGRPLVQIVYLPERGDPVALCVIDAKQAQPMKTQRVYGMDVISWTQDKLAFALIGRNDSVDLAAVHKQLAEVPPLVHVE